MPMVGGKKFPYTKAGKAAAEKAEKGLYANINAKKKRIAAGSGEKMRKVGLRWQSACSATWPQAGPWRKR